jgi:folate-binding protein YgfZ
MSRGMSSSMNAATASVWAWTPEKPACSLQPASLIRLEGADALRVLHGQTSAAIESARPGQWIGTCCISPTARMRALAEVLVDDGGAWLVVHAGDGAQVHAALDRVLFPADRVRLGAVEPIGWLTPVPSPDEVLDPAGDAGTWQALAAGQGWQLGSGVLGQALVLRDPDPTRWPEAWRQRQPLSAQEQERWRLHQGLPAAPGELNEEHNPFELGLAGRVSLNKGCYVGQETLAKLATYDGVKQQLRRWHWPHTPGERAPEPADELWADATDGETTRLGRITSMLALETGDRIGLALVRRRGLDREQLQAGTTEAQARLTLSRPSRFIDPPVGAGGDR